MRDTLKATAYGVLGLGVLVAVAFALRGAGLASETTFAPREEALRRRVFEQSKAFVQGNVDELRSMQAQYITTDSTHRVALRAVILHRADNVPAGRIPDDLAAFLSTLRTERVR